jgi:protein SCO1/2
MRVRTRLLLVAAAAVACLGSGYNSPPEPRTGPPPPPPQVGIDQHLGAVVPLHLPFKDEHGHRVTLGEVTAGKPTILVMAYYRCPMLCTEVLNGLLRVLRATPDTAGDAFSVVIVSFDPREKPPLAAVKKATYLQEYGRPGAENGWHFLTGDPLAIATLADTVGFRYEYDPKTEQYAHGSGLVVLAPDGTVCRYLFGVKFDPRDLRLSLSEASDGKVGSPADQVLLLCYQYNPATGTYTFQIMKAVRLLSGVVLAGLAAMLVVLFRRGRRSEKAEAQAATPNPEG